MVHVTGLERKSSNYLLIIQTVKDSKCKDSCILTVSGTEGNGGFFYEEKRDYSYSV